MSGQTFQVYGVPEFFMQPWLLVAFPCTLSGIEESTNKKAKTYVPKVVEWSYKDIKQQFSTSDFRCNFHSRNQPIELMYKECTKSLKVSGIL